MIPIKRDFLRIDMMGREACFVWVVTIGGDGKAEVEHWTPKRNVGDVVRSTLNAARDQGSPEDKMWGRAWQGPRRKFRKDNTEYTSLQIGRRHVNRAQMSIRILGLFLYRSFCGSERKVHMSRT